MNIAELAIKRPVFVVMLILSIITLGLIGFSNLGIDLLPNVEYPAVTVIVVYPGASAEEMESLVAKKLEDALSTLQGLDTISSTSREGVAYVTAQFSLGVDVKYAESKVKEKVDAVKRLLPEDAEDPVVSRYSVADFAVTYFTMFGKLSVPELYDIAENDVKPVIEKAKGVARLEIFGGREKQVKITVSKAALAAKAVTLSSIAAAVKSENLNIPAGKITDSGSNALVRVTGTFESIEDIMNIPVKNEFGGVVYLKDLAKIEMGFSEETQRARLNGENSLLLGVYKQSGENTVAVADRAKERVKQLQKKLPEGVKIDVFRDVSSEIKTQINGVKEDIFSGILLAVIIVFLFLGNFRSTVITALALPNSLIGAFFLVWISGFSVNVLVLMAMSLAIGLLIDDSIIVRENIFRYMEHGMAPRDAAVKGTNEVAMAVLATTASIMAVFIPIAFIGGVVGQYFKQFGLTIAFALLISLIDAFTTAPMLSAYWWKKQEKAESGIGAITAGFSEKWNRFYEKLNAVYREILLWALEHKRTVIISAAGLFALSIFLILFVDKKFLPEGDMEFIEINVETYPGASLAYTDSKVADIEKYISTIKGVEKYRILTGNSGENTASFFIVLEQEGKSKKKREKIASGIMDYIERNHGTELSAYRADTGGAEVISGGGDTSAFVVKLMGPDIKVLEKISRDVKEAARSVAGVTDLDTTYRPGKPEIVIKPDRPKTAKLDISSYQIGATLSTLIRGTELSKLRAGDKEYPIVLELDGQAKNSMDAVGGILLTAKSGDKVPVSAISDIRYTAGPVEIKKENKKKIIKVTANITEGYSLGDIVARVDANIKSNVKMPEGYEYEFGGQAEQMKDTFEQMGKAMALAVLFMYMILASLYNSFIQPVILMLSIPLAIIGAVIALLLTGQPLDVMAMIGFLMVFGLVAKNGILLIDFTNKKRYEEGMSARDALLTAGPIRLRPILMTTFAMVFGMLPLALGLGEQGYLRTQSMPIAVIGGLLTSTFLTLVVIPVVYEWVETRFGKK